MNADGSAIDGGAGTQLGCKHGFRLFVAFGSDVINDELGLGFDNSGFSACDKVLGCCSCC